jgi:hypothetical protein
MECAFNSAFPGALQGSWCVLFFYYRYGTKKSSPAHRRGCSQNLLSFGRLKCRVHFHLGIQILSLKIGLFSDLDFGLVFSGSGLLVVLLDLDFGLVFFWIWILGFFSDVGFFGFLYKYGLKGHN